MVYKIIYGGCLEELENLENKIDLTFLDPPFNQGKKYRKYNDNKPKEEYWRWIKEICKKIYNISNEGSSIYLMHREKNVENVMRILKETNWNFHNLIIWVKHYAPNPYPNKLGKQYQIITHSIKGEKPRIFNKLRINKPPLDYSELRKYPGIFINDVWNDIKELTGGFFASKEAIRNKNKERIHYQQSPIHLLLRIILFSSLPDDWILDPFAGTGTTSIVCEQLKRNSISIEIDPENIKIIKNRLKKKREIDDIRRFQNYYQYTDNLRKIWPTYSKKIMINKNIKSFLKE